MSSGKDYYKVLGLARDCDEEEIKKAYRCVPRGTCVWMKRLRC